MLVQVIINTFIRGDIGYVRERQIHKNTTVRSTDLNTFYNETPVALKLYPNSKLRIVKACCCKTRNEFVDGSTMVNLTIVMAARLCVLTIRDA